MRVVVQRVSRAAVRVDGATVGAIGRGFLVLVGFNSDDAEPALRWMAEKLVGLRVFSDADDKMNLAIERATTGFFEQLDGFLVKPDPDTLSVLS